MKLMALAGTPGASIPRFRIPLERASATATIPMRTSAKIRPARGIEGRLGAMASRGRSKRPRGLGKTGTIAIVAIAILRWAAKLVASNTAATATSGASFALGVRITDTIAAAKKKSTRAKYFCCRLPGGAVVIEASRGFQSMMVAEVVGLRIENVSVYQ